MAVLTSPSRWRRDELMSSLTERTTDGIFRQYGLTDSTICTARRRTSRWTIDANNLLLVSMSNEIMEAVAQRGNVVILGRTEFRCPGRLCGCAECTYPGPFSERVQRVMAREGLTTARPPRSGCAKTTMWASQICPDVLQEGTGMRHQTSTWSSTRRPLSSDAAVRAADRRGGENLEQKTPGKDAATTAQIEVDPVWRTQSPR